MQPLSPVIPDKDAPETVYAKDQPEYIPLPSVKTPDGIVLTRWSVSEQEKKQILEQGYFYLLVSTFNTPLQPVMLTTEVPEGMNFNAAPLEEWPTEIDA